MIKCPRGGAEIHLYTFFATSLGGLGKTPRPPDRPEAASGPLCWPSHYSTMYLQQGRGLQHRQVPCVKERCCESSAELEKGSCSLLSLLHHKLNSVRGSAFFKKGQTFLMEGGPFGLPPSGLNRQLAAERAILRAAGGRQVHSQPGAEPLAALPASVLQVDINICVSGPWSCAARPLCSSSRALTPRLAPAAEARRSGGRQRMEHAKCQRASPAAQQGRLNGAPAGPAGAPAQRHRVGRRRAPGVGRTAVQRWRAPVGEGGGGEGGWGARRAVGASHVACCRDAASRCGGHSAAADAERL